MTAAGAAARWAKPGARERASARMKHKWENPEARARLSARVKQSLRYKPERTMSDDEREFFQDAHAFTPARQAMALAYRRGLMKAVEETTVGYAWARDPATRDEAVRAMAVKILHTLDDGTPGWDSQGWKNACQELGIRHQLKAILAYWRS